MKRCINLGLLAILVIVSAGFDARPVIAQDLQPAGVRGTLYESPNYGYTLTWDPSQWVVQSAHSEYLFDQLHLASRTGEAYLESFPIMVGPESYEFALETCVRDSIDEFANNPLVYSSEIVHSHGIQIDLFGSVTGADLSVSAVDINGQSYDAIVIIKCMHRYDTDFIVETNYVSSTWNTVQHENYIEAPEFDELLARLAPPLDGWTPRYLDDSNVPAQGVLEVDVTLEAVDNGSGRIFYVNVILRNVDIVGASIDVSSLVLAGFHEVHIYPAMYEVLAGASPTAGPRFYLMPGDVVTVTLTYIDEWRDALWGLCIEHDGECIPILTCAIDSACGVGSRPRVALD